MVMWELWNDLLSEQDKAVIRAAGYEQQGAASWKSRSCGKRPAVLVVDMQRLLVGPDVPILEAIRHYRTAMGHVAWQAVPHVKALLATARAAGAPVFYTRIIPQQHSSNDDAVQIISALTPEPADVIVDKRHASAFYGTDLRALLEGADIDTLILAGNATSGCIRATAVDARQYGFNPVIPVECVFDRIEASHRISLLDLWMKYAVVQPLDDICAYLKTTGDARQASIEKKREDSNGD